MNQDDLTIVVPSKGRAMMAARQASTLLPSAFYLVAESEKQEYLLAGIPSKRLWTHPDLYGLARIRNWATKTSPTDVTIQIDDDVSHVCAWPGEHRRVYKDPTDVLHIIANTAQVALEGGAKMFCWSNAGKPLYFRPHDPFGFTGPASRALGTIGKDVVWDEHLVTMVDSDATLAQLLSNRFILSDNRFYFHAEVIFGNAGGMQAIRTNERREADKKVIKRKWGNYLDIDGKSKGGQSKNQIKVERRQNL